jgi:hypothetical protein
MYGFQLKAEMPELVRKTRFGRAVIVIFARQQP